MRAALWHISLPQVKAADSEASRAAAVVAARGFRASLQNATRALADEAAAAANATATAASLVLRAAVAEAKLTSAEESIKGFKVCMSLPSHH